MARRGRVLSRSRQPRPTLERARCRAPGRRCSPSATPLGASTPARETADRPELAFIRRGHFVTFEPPDEASGSSKMDAQEPDFLRETNWLLEPHLPRNQGDRVPDAARL